MLSRTRLLSQFARLSTTTNPAIKSNNKIIDPSATLDDCDLIHGLTPEQRQLRQTVRSFAERELTPGIVQQMDREGHWPEFRTFWQKLGRLGLLGPTVGPEYGGLDLGYFEHAIAMEEISRSCPAIGLSYGAHSNLCVNQINLNGTEEQKSKYLPKLIDGSHIGSLAMSETSSGSDVTSMKLRAERHGDYFVLNGSKFWITNGTEADVIFVYAKTSEKGITAFIVEKDFEGFSIGSKIDKLGMRASPTAELVFTDCKVPAKNVVRGVNEGVYVLMSGLDYERLVLSGGPVGIMQRAMEESFRYAHERKQFDREIGKFQLLQGMMADMHVGASTCRSYLYNTARAVDASLKVKSQVPLSKGSSRFTKDCAGVILYAAETATKMCLDAIQILGGNGYTNDYIVGMLLRDAKLYEIGAGTSEIRRWLIGRELNSEWSHHFKN